MREVGAVAMVEYDKFRNSLKRLEEQRANYRNTGSLSPSTTSRGETGDTTSYDCPGKVLREDLTRACGIQKDNSEPFEARMKWLVARLVSGGSKFDSAGFLG